MSNLLLNIARGLLPLASFAGLCAFIRVRFDINRFLAPFAAASGIIAILTLAGMLNVLWATCVLLYALGILALIRVYSKNAPPRTADSDVSPLFRVSALALPGLQAPALR